MNRRLAGQVVSTTLAGSLLLASTSCATHIADGAATAVPRPAAQIPGAQRLVQLSFAPEAAFGRCVEPACPAVTPKTISVASAAPMHAVAHRVALPADVAREPGTQMEGAPLSSPTNTDSLRTTDAEIRTVVVFPFASAQLTATARTALRASIRHAKQSHRIVIAGRTDAVGDDQANESLALARAVSVRNYLHGQVPDLAAVVTIHAKGRCCYVAANQTEDGRSMNRRVEITFFSRGGS